MEPASVENNRRLIRSNNISRGKIFANSFGLSCACIPFRIMSNCENKEFVLDNLLNRMSFMRFSVRCVLSGRGNDLTSGFSSVIISPEDKDNLIILKF